jgi:hypothetical protein
MAIQIDSKKWDTLTRSQKIITIVSTSVSGVIQLTLMILAWRDLRRRPAEQIRGGKKWVWVLVSLMDYVGPLAYFIFGRKPASQPSEEVIAPQIEIENRQPG